MNSRRTNRFRSVLSLECLEPRDAPATLVSGTKLSYQDADGDDVTVTFSKSILTAANVNSVFTFTPGSVNGSNATKQQLRVIDLTGIGAAATGTSIITVATRNAVTGGDGFAAVGEINAKGINLGMVTIDGDLVHVDAGTGIGTALPSLTANSMGLYQTATEVTGSMISDLNGRLGSVHVNGDAVSVTFRVATGGIGSIWIGGSFRGGRFAGGITTLAGDIGPIKIGGDFVGGGSSMFQIVICTGWINCAGNLASLTVGGSLIGSTYDLNDSQIFSGGNMGPVKIGGDIIGGVGKNGASIKSGGSMGALTVGGSIVCGAGTFSAQIASGANIGPITVAGNVGEVASSIGSSYSADIYATLGKIASLSIGGSLLASRSFDHVANVQAHTIGTVKIGGSVSGGNDASAQIVTLGGDIGSVTIGGSLMGGFGQVSGEIQSGGNLGPVSIGGSIRGGGHYSGTVFAMKKVASITIGGSVLSGPGIRSGSIGAFGVLGPITVKGSIIGTPAQPVDIRAPGGVPPSSGPDVAIASIHVFGRVEYADIRAGWANSNVVIDADAQIGQVTVDGDWLWSNLSAGVSPGVNGCFGDADDAKPSGPGINDQPLVVSKIAGITIGGQVVGMLGNPGHFGMVAETIGAVRIGGTALVLHAGAHNDNIPLGLMNDLNVLEI